jgi:UDP-N-acetylglucosamine 4,6-dehydratase
MCPADDSHLTLAFARHFVIRPAIDFDGQDGNFTVDGLGERGTPVAEGFEYNSGANERFLTAAEISESVRTLAGP